MYNIYTKYKNENRIHSSIPKNSSNFNNDNIPNINIFNLPNPRNIHSSQSYRTIYNQNNKIKLIPEEQKILFSEKTQISKKKNLNSFKNPNNLTSTIILQNKIKSPDISDNIFIESRKNLEIKKKLRSKIYKLLKSKETIPICTDFYSKIDGFNRKLLHWLESDFKINKEKLKNNHFHFSNKYNINQDIKHFTNTQDLQKNKFPVDKLIKSTFTTEELEIIKHDLDFFNKNNKILNTIKFLKPKSLINLFNEEDLESEFIQKNKEKNLIRLKSFKAYKFLKQFVINKFKLVKDSKRQYIFSDLSRNGNSIERNQQERIIREREKKLIKHSSNLIKFENKEENFHENKYVRLLFDTLAKQLIENKHNLNLEGFIPENNNINNTNQENNRNKKMPSLILQNKVSNTENSQVNFNTRPKSNNSKDKIDNIMHREGFSKKNDLVIFKIKNNFYINKS